jgi:SNF2 family DNA or RNA helicase
MDKKKLNDMYASDLRKLFRELKIGKYNGKPASVLKKDEMIEAISDYYKTRPKAKTPKAAPKAKTPKIKIPKTPKAAPKAKTPKKSPKTKTLKTSKAASRKAHEKYKENLERMKIKELKDLFKLLKIGRYNDKPMSKLNKAELVNAVYDHTKNLQQVPVPSEAPVTSESTIVPGPSEAPGPSESKAPSTVPGPSQSQGEPDCISRSKLPLKPHQKALVEHLLSHRGAVAVHDVGTGKTLLAVAASQCILDANKNMKVVVLTPKSLQENFKKELIAYGAKNTKEKYTFYTIEKFRNLYNSSGLKCKKNTFLIVDEAHNLRSHGSGKSQAVVDCARHVDKVLLMSASPIYNNPYDVENLVAIVRGTKAMGELSFKELLKDTNEKKFKEHFGCVFSFFNVDKHNLKDYPIKREQTITLHMTPKYLKEYKKVEESKSKLFSVEDPFAFLMGVRQATNAFDPCQKCKWTYDKILEGEKTVVYSAFKTNGIVRVQDILNKKKISYVEITGSMTAGDRGDAVIQFNKQNGPNVLFITKAGSEGLDLKGVRNVILLEKGYNREGEKQVIGRAVRYMSHAHLKPGERSVNVYHLILAKPSIKGDEKPSADEILRDVVEKKERLNKVFEDKIRALSIENLEC